MRRCALRGDQWERIRGLLPGREGRVGVTAADNQLFVEAALCKTRRLDAPEEGWAPRAAPWPTLWATPLWANPVGFFLAGGQAYGLAGAGHLLPGMKADMLIADKAFDADKRVIEPLAQAGKTSAVPSKASRKAARDHDKGLCQARRLVEHFSARLKQFRAVATRYDKTAQNFLGGTHLAASLAWLN